MGVRYTHTFWTCQITDISKDTYYHQKAACSKLEASDLGFYSTRQFTSPSLWPHLQVLHAARHINEKCWRALSWVMYCKSPALRVLNDAFCNLQRVLHAMRHKRWPLVQCDSQGVLYAKRNKRCHSSRFQGVFLRTACYKTQKIPCVLWPLNWQLAKY